MNSLEIIKVTQRQPWSSTILNWVEKEWPNVVVKRNESRETRLFGDFLPDEFPSVLGALNHRTLIGFVCIIYHAKSSEIGRPYWIDALYVESSFRHQGVATRLIAEAELRALELGAAQLFAFTDIPPLYEKSGWLIEQRVSEGENPGTVMRKTLLP